MEDLFAVSKSRKGINNEHCRQCRETFASEEERDAHEKTHKEKP